MSSMFQNRSFILPQISKNQSLPVSSQAPNPSDTTTTEDGLRRRVSSSNIAAATNPASFSFSSTLWGFRRSKSEASMMGDFRSTGSAIRKWWEWGWGWVLSRKPTFAQDLEMNEHELSVLGSQNKGSWKHLLFKAGSQIRKLMGSDRNMGLPQTCRYDSLGYAQKGAVSLR